MSETKPEQNIPPTLEKYLPTVNKNGQPHASSGLGPVKTYQLRPPQDLDEIEKRGFMPAGGLSFDPNDTKSLANIRYRKFSPERQRIYLEALATHGRHNLAAVLAGVTPGCAAEMAKTDTEFGENRKIAEQIYYDTSVALIMAQAREGMKDIRYNGEGKVISIRTSYETRLRELLVKRGDPSFIETQKSEVAVQGGAVIVPAPVEVEGWEATVAKYGVKKRGVETPILAESRGGKDTE